MKQPIDDIEDRMGSVHPLDFEKDDRRTPPRVGEEDSRNDFEAEQAREAGLTGAAMPDHQPTLDDLSPETLIDESGARDADEAGGDNPLDRQVRVVGAREAGTGGGLDEEELALVDPLDGRPDDNAEPLDDDELASDAPLNDGAERAPGAPEDNK